MNLASKQRIQGNPSLSQTRSEIEFSWITDTLFCRIPRVYITGSLLRVLYSHFDTGTINPYSIRLYDEHDVDILESLGVNLAASTNSQFELRHNYGSSLYGPIIVDGQFTIEVQSTDETYGSFNLLMEKD